jgi:hypothetical protein
VSGRHGSGDIVSGGRRDTPDSTWFIDEARWSLITVTFFTPSTVRICVSQYRERIVQFSSSASASKTRAMSSSAQTPCINHFRSNISIHACGINRHWRASEEECISSASWRTARCEIRDREDRWRRCGSRDQRLGLSFSPRPRRRLCHLQSPPLPIRTRCRPRSQ